MLGSHGGIRPSEWARSIEWTTSANSTVTCLYSAWVSGSDIGEPQLPQNRAPSRGSVPHVRHAAMAVIRPSAARGSGVSRVLPRIGRLTPARPVIATESLLHRRPGHRSGSWSLKWRELPFGGVRPGAPSSADPRSQRYAPITILIRPKAKTRRGFGATTSHQTCGTKA